MRLIGRSPWSNVKSRSGREKQNGMSVFNDMVPAVTCPEHPCCRNKEDAVAECYLTS